MASMIGMPAFMKTPSCREKWLMSLRGTIFLVISKLEDALLLADLERLEAALEQGEVRSTGRRAVSTPETLRPVGVDRLVGELCDMSCSGS